MTPISASAYTEVHLIGGHGCCPDHSSSNRASFDRIWAWQGATPPSTPSSTTTASRPVSRLQSAVSCCVMPVGTDGPPRPVDLCRTSPHSVCMTEIASRCKGIRSRSHACQHRPSSSNIRPTADRIDVDAACLTTRHPSPPRRSMTAGETDKAVQLCTPVCGTCQVLPVAASATWQA